MSEVLVEHLDPAPDPVCGLVCGLVCDPDPAGF